VDDPIERRDAPRLDPRGSETVVRVVLAEADAPGSLHYLIEAEGCRVVGCASDDIELRRVLEQDVRPDVIVLDGEVTASALLVARELSPSSHVIVIWPDGVQLPSAAERVPPRLVYEQLGPTIRRVAGGRQLPEPIVVTSSEEPIASAEESDPGVRRAASRVSVTTVTLVAAIVLTMGASFALDGWNTPNAAAPSRSTAPKSTDVRSSTTVAAPATAQQRRDVQGSKREPCPPTVSSDRKVPNAHAGSSVPSTDDATCQHPVGGPVNGSAHPDGTDHGLGNSDGAGNSGGSNGQSDAHGRPEELPSSTAATGHGPKS
jgi:hypothetical protein